MKRRGAGWLPWILAAASITMLVGCVSQNDVHGEERVLARGVSKTDYEATYRVDKDNRSVFLDQDRNLAILRKKVDTGLLFGFAPSRMTSQTFTSFVRSPGSP